MEGSGRESLPTAKDSNTAGGKKKKCCPDCAKKGITSRIRLKRINFEDAIYICDNEACLFPLTCDPSQLFVRRKVRSDLGNWRGKKKGDGVAKETSHTENPADSGNAVASAAPAFDFDLDNLFREAAGVTDDFQDSGVDDLAAMLDALASADAEGSPNVQPDARVANLDFLERPGEAASGIDLLESSSTTSASVVAAAPDSTDDDFSAVPDCDSVACPAIEGLAPETFVSEMPSVDHDDAASVLTDFSSDVFKPILTGNAKSYPKKQKDGVVSSNPMDVDGPIGVQSDALVTGAEVAISDFLGRPREAVPDFGMETNCGLVASSTSSEPIPLVAASNLATDDLAPEVRTNSSGDHDDSATELNNTSTNVTTDLRNEDDSVASSEQIATSQPSNRDLLKIVMTDHSYTTERTPETSPNDVGRGFVTTASVESAYPSAAERTVVDSAKCDQLAVDESTASRKLSFTDFRLRRDVVPPSTTLSGLGNKTQVDNQKNSPQKSFSQSVVASNSASAASDSASAAGEISADNRLAVKDCAASKKLTFTDFRLRRDAVPPSTALSGLGNKTQVDNQKTSPQRSSSRSAVPPSLNPSVKITRCTIANQQQASNPPAAAKEPASTPQKPVQAANSSSANPQGKQTVMVFAIKGATPQPSNFQMVSLNEQQFAAIQKQLAALGVAASSGQTATNSLATQSARVPANSAVRAASAVPQNRSVRGATGKTAAVGAEPAIGRTAKRRLSTVSESPQPRGTGRVCKKPKVTESVFAPCLDIFSCVASLHKPQPKKPKQPRKAPVRKPKPKREAGAECGETRPPEAAISRVSRWLENQKTSTKHFPGYQPKYNRSAVVRAGSLSEDSGIQSPMSGRSEESSSSRPIR